MSESPQSALLLPWSYLGVFGLYELGCRLDRSPYEQGKSVTGVRKNFSIEQVAVGLCGTSVERY